MTPEEAKQIISNAINDEVEAYTYYKNVSEKAKDPALKQLFGELAGEEQNHRELLQTFLTKDTAEMKFSPQNDYKVAGTLETPKFSDT